MNTFKFSFASILFFSANLLCNEEVITTGISGKGNPQIEINGVSKYLYGHILKAKNNPLFSQTPVYKYDPTSNSFENLGTIQTHGQKILAQITNSNWVYLPNYAIAELKETKEFAQIGILVVGTDQAQEVKKAFAKAKL